MKKLVWIIYAVILLCVVGTVIFLILSPDQVPVHYSFSGSVDRIGSKYEMLFFPAFAVGMGVLFLFQARPQKKQGDAANETMLLWVGASTLILLTALSFYFMVKAIRYDPDAAAAGMSVVNANRFVSIGIGALLVVFGNLMPKARRNSLVGVRTRWSMANDAVWQKSQRFGGITMVVSGFVMILLAPLIPGMWNVLMTMVVLTAAAILCCAASYRYYRADQEGNQK